MKLPFDEMLDAAGKARPHYQIFHNWLKQQSDTLIGLKRAEADLIFRRVGITFAAYGDDLGSERTIPFDQVPRIFTAKEWEQLEAGLRQRVKALNRFIYDVYHDEEIIKAGIVPAEQIYNNAQYRPEMRNVSVPRDIYAQIAGIDIVRAGEGEFYVLEDNLRVPSGVSYMVEDHKMMMRIFPDLLQNLDPLAFRSDSTLGVAGLLSAHRAGNVTLANAIGTGIADGKSIYPYVPEMIEFYLGEKPILNNVPTFQCRKTDDLAYTLANLEKLVVKLMHGTGGYGIWHVGWPSIHQSRD